VEPFVTLCHDRRDSVHGQFSAAGDVECGTRLACHGT
jgi:hypothetical protein